MPPPDTVRHGPHEFPWIKTSNISAPSVRSHAINPGLRLFNLGRTYLDSTVCLASYFIPVEAAIATRTKATTPGRQFIRRTGSSPLGGLDGLEPKIWSANCALPISFVLTYLHRVRHHPLESGGDICRRPFVSRSHRGAHGETFIYLFR